MVEPSTASSLELENSFFLDQTGIHHQVQSSDVPVHVPADMPVELGSVDSQGIYGLMVSIGSPETVLLGGGVSAFRSWSDFDLSPVLIVRNNLYSPVLLENFLIPKFDIIKKYLEKNSDLFDILIRLPKFLEGKIIFREMSLDYFVDEAEGMEFITIKLSIDDVDDTQITGIETHILDEFFYPQSEVIQGRLVLLM